VSSAKLSGTEFLEADEKSDKFWKRKLQNRREIRGLLSRALRALGHLDEAQGNNRVPALALTAFAHTNDAREAGLAGFQIHIPKPVNIGNLTAAIRSLTG
jgi:CheY-like chemotaxis protein